MPRGRGGGGRASRVGLVSCCICIREWRSFGEDGSPWQGCACFPCLWTQAAQVYVHSQAYLLGQQAGVRRGASESEPGRSIEGSGLAACSTAISESDGSVSETSSAFYDFLRSCRGVHLHTIVDLEDCRVDRDAVLQPHGHRIRRQHAAMPSRLQLSRLPADGKRKPVVSSFNDSRDHSSPTRGVRTGPRGCDTEKTEQAQDHPGTNANSNQQRRQETAARNRASV